MCQKQCRDEVRFESFDITFLYKGIHVPDNTKFKLNFFSLRHAMHDIASTSMLVPFF